MTTYALFLGLVLPALGALWLFTQARSREHRLLALAGLPAGAALSTLVLAGSFFSATSATEILSGQVTGKTRVHGSYQRPYECRCRNVRRSNSSQTDRVCDTCYEDRYTVKWACQTTVGEIAVDSLDRSSRSVYLSPDPARYLAVRVGEPAAREQTYTNYVHAAGDSVVAAYGDPAAFPGLVPAYPGKVYDLYRVDRYLTPGWADPAAPAWNAAIGDLLRERGARKQVNLVVVVAKAGDRAYAGALRAAWKGGQKNDVVVVLGVTEWPAVAWADVFSWAEDEGFNIRLRDRLTAVGAVDRDRVLAAAAAEIDATYRRRPMSDYSFLDVGAPPTWAVLTLLAALAAGYGLAGLWLRRQ